MNKIILIICLGLMFFFHCSSAPINRYAKVLNCKIIKKEMVENKKIVIVSIGVPNETGSYIKKRTVACERALICAQKEILRISKNETKKVKGGVITSKIFDHFANCTINYQSNIHP